MKVRNLAIAMAITGSYVGVQQSAASLAEMFADRGRASNDQSQRYLDAERAKTAELVAEYMIPFHNTVLEFNARTGVHEIHNSVSWPFDYAL